MLVEVGDDNMLTFDEAYKIASNINKNRSDKKISDIRDVGDGWLFDIENGLWDMGTAMYTSMLQSHGHVKAFHRLSPEQSKNFPPGPSANTDSLCRKLPLDLSPHRCYSLHVASTDLDPIRLAKAVSLLNRI